MCHGGFLFRGGWVVLGKVDLGVDKGKGLPFAAWERLVEVVEGCIVL